MHITLEADYAIRIVHCLSIAEKRMDAKAIAACTGVTLRFSLKILRKLVAAQIIKSYKGTQGGYEMAKSPDQVTLYDVVSTIEGDLHLSRCLDDQFPCTREKEGQCRFQQVFQQLSEELAQRLRSITFEQLK